MIDFCLLRSRNIFLRNFSRRIFFLYLSASFSFLCISMAFLISILFTFSFVCKKGNITQPTHISEKMMWFEFFSCSFSATTLRLKTEICGRKQLGKNKTRKRGLFAKAFHQISKQNAKKILVFIYLVKSQELMQKARHFRLFS